MSQEKVRLLKRVRRRGDHHAYRGAAGSSRELCAEGQAASCARRRVRCSPGSSRTRRIPAAHAATTGPELWEQTEGRITHFVASAGTGGTCQRRRSLSQVDESEHQDHRGRSAGLGARRALAHERRRASHRRAVQGGRHWPGLRAEDARHERGGRVHHGERQGMRLRWRAISRAKRGCSSAGRRD